MSDELEIETPGQSVAKRLALLLEPTDPHGITNKTIRISPGDGADAFVFYERIRRIPLVEIAAALAGDQDA